MKHKLNLKLIACVALVALTGLTGFAQEKAAANTTAAPGYTWAFWTFGLLVSFVLILLVNLSLKLRALRKQGAVEHSAFHFSWGFLNKLNKWLFTRAVPIEQEADILLDHDYDGIRELDNSLPPWWKYGFYITIVVAVFYFFRYHVWKTGPDPEQEYATEMQLAANKLEEYRKNAHDDIDEKTVTMADAAGLAEGQKIFQTTCFPCHGAKGEGGVGPNLTDAYWLHGGSINDVFKTIKLGVPDKGMQSWKSSFSSIQIKNIASYVKSLSGTNPPNAKAPQGEPYVEKKTEKTDSTHTAQKDAKLVAKK